MKDDIKVSVIITTYKTPREFLDKAINSVLLQTYKNFEFIIVCDGDVEEYEYIKRYKDDRIKLILHKQNLGIAKSTNDALKITTGKYIMRMDSDDASVKDRIEIQLNYMEKHKNIDISYMQALCFNKTVTIRDSYYRKPEEIEIQLLYTNTITHSAVMIRKDFLDKNNIEYNENYKCSLDYELWTRAIKNANIAEIHRIGVLYRVHNNQISSKKKQLQIQLKERAIKENNIKKIKNDDRTLQALLFLTGDKKVIIDNYKSFIEDIEYIIKNNTKYNKKLFEKVLYTRFFQIVISNSELKKNLLILIKDKKSRKILFTSSNMKYVICKFLKKIRVKFCKIIYKKFIEDYK